mmetsp:Transcript_26787/g.76020  ORF Transcript_26787/g.76020 Transcript_26787/m.76020 type:complete len:242 (-) Transcript_26787:13-738(-)
MAHHGRRQRAIAEFLLHHPAHQRLHLHPAAPPEAPRRAHKLAGLRRLHPVLEVEVAPVLEGPLQLAGVRGHLGGLVQLLLELDQQAQHAVQPLGRRLPRGGVEARDAHGVRATWPLRLPAQLLLRHGRVRDGHRARKPIALVALGLVRVQPGAVEKRSHALHHLVQALDAADVLDKARGLLGRDVEAQCRWAEKVVLGAARRLLAHTAAGAHSMAASLPPIPPPEPSAGSDAIHALQAALR